MEWSAKTLPLSTSIWFNDGVRRLVRFWASLSKNSCRRVMTANTRLMRFHDSITPSTKKNYFVTGMSPIMPNCAFSGANTIMSCRSTFTTGQTTSSNHCMERIPVAHEIPDGHVILHDDTSGQFSVRSQVPDWNDQWYSLSFGDETSFPRFECRDWERHLLPCKRFLAVFSRLRNGVLSVFLKTIGTLLS